MPYMKNIPIPPCDFSQIENNARSENIYWKGESFYPSTYFLLTLKENFVSSNNLQRPAILNLTSNFMTFDRGNQFYYVGLEQKYTLFKTLVDQKNLSYGGIQSENFGSNSMVDFALQSLTKYFSKNNFPQNFQTLKDVPNAGDNALYLFEEYADKLCYLGNPLDAENDWTNAQHAVRVWLNETDILMWSSELGKLGLPKTLFNILYISGNEYLKERIRNLLVYGVSASTSKEIAIVGNLFVKTTHVLNILFMLDYLGEQRLGDGYLNTPTIIGLEIMNFAYLSWMKDKILDTVGVRVERERYQPIQESKWLSTPEEWEKNLKSRLKAIGVKSPETINLLVKVYNKGGDLTHEDFIATVLSTFSWDYSTTPNTKRTLAETVRYVRNILDNVEAMLTLKFNTEIPGNIDTILNLGKSKNDLIRFLINTLKVRFSEEYNQNQNQNQNINEGVSGSKSSRNYMIFGVIAGLGLTYYLIRRNSPN